MAAPRETPHRVRSHLEGADGIPATAPARILDCGGGPGRYAIELARPGYQVTLFDLSEGCLELAQRKAEEAGVGLEGVVQGSALDLSCFPDETFDVVLNLGPFYHLLESEERLRALKECKRVLEVAAFAGQLPQPLCRTP